MVGANTNNYSQLQQQSFPSLYIIIYYYLTPPFLWNASYWFVLNFNQNRIARAEISEHNLVHYFLLHYRSA
jgi:hypothetical protein